MSYLNPTNPIKSQYLININNMIIILLVLVTVITYYYYFIISLSLSLSLSQNDWAMGAILKNKDRTNIFY